VSKSAQAYTLSTIIKRYEHPKTTPTLTFAYDYGSYRETDLHHHPIDYLMI
jgi:hypothetical protein